MLDMRYHVISLVAVFLALGIGILLGTTIVERGLIAEQKAQIKSLGSTFDEIKAKNAELNQELSAYKNYADQSRSYLTSGKLAGKSYAVLAKKDPDGKALSSVYDAITAAGGTVPATISISGSDAYKDPAVLLNLNTLFAMQGDQKALQARVYAEVVNQLRTASNVGIFTTLQQLGVIQVRGSLTAPVDAAVLIGPVEENGLDKTDVPLIGAFVSTAFPLVGVSGTAAPDSIMLTYKKNAISTIDHVDTVPGQVATVLVLRGTGGNFGSGSAAGRVLPEPVLP